MPRNSCGRNLVASDQTLTAHQTQHLSVQAIGNHTHNDQQKVNTWNKHNNPTQAASSYEKTQILNLHQQAPADL